MLRDKLLEGWKMRLSVKRTLNHRNFRKGVHPHIEHKDKPWFTTATKYLGPTKKVNGYPYLKLFLYPNGDRVWSLSNWANPSTAPHVSTQLALLSATEMDRVFECLETLDMLVSTNEMTHLIGLAKAQEMGDCVKFPHKTKA
jgi:hypothetical protein